MNELEIINQIITVLTISDETKQRYAADIESLVQRREQYKKNKFRLGVIGVSRRQKTHALITQMAKLNIALTQFEFTYNQIKDSIGSIETVETYISDIKFQIKKISYEKNSRK